MPGHQEFTVSLGSLDRAVGEAHHPPPGQTVEPGRDAFADFVMQFGVAHDAAPADAPLADLELRFDQGNQAGVRRGEAQRRRQNGLQPDKTGVAHDKIDRLGNVFPGQMARVGFFKYDDAIVLAQLPGQLSAPDIDRINLMCAARQGHIGKPAARRADIETDQAGWIDGEMIERAFQLEPAARDPGMGLAANFDRGFDIDGNAGFVEAALAAEHHAGQDQRLRLGPVFGKAPFDQQRIETGFGAFIVQEEWAGAALSKNALTTVHHASNVKIRPAWAENRLLRRGPARPARRRQYGAR